MKKMSNFNYQKSVMILGAAYSQLPLYEAAKRMKIRTIAVSINGEYPAFDIADEVIKVDVKDTKHIYKEALKRNINGIITCGNDWGIESVGYICEKMKLNGPTINAARCCNNKYEMHLAFENHAVNSPKYIKINSFDSIDQQKITYPVIVKAVDLMGGRGIYYCKNSSETKNAYLEILKQSKYNYCLIEEYLNGHSIGVEGIVQNGKIIAALINNTITTSTKVKIPIGHSIPLKDKQKHSKSILRELHKAIKAVKINGCAFNVDAIIKNNKVYVIELTCRAGANGLCDLMSYHYDVDYYEALLLLALGENISPLFKKSNNKAISFGFNNYKDIKKYELPIIKTPIQKLKINTNNNVFYCKRDDHIPYSYGGSKVRLAEEILIDIKNKDNIGLIIYGGYQSNLCRILSKVCKDKNIYCCMITNVDDGEINKNTFNAKLIVKNKVKEYLCDKSNIAKIVTKAMNDIKEKGLTPYYIYGNAYGMGNEKTLLKAGINIYKEIADQEKEFKCKFDYIFLATSSNIIQSGIVAGKILYQGKEKIVGISVNRSKQRATREIRKNLKCINVDKMKDIIVDDTCLFKGYGKYNKKLINFCKQLYKIEGIQFDPVYTGKGFYGMLEYLKDNNIEQKRVLFIHTGGQPIFIEEIKSSCND